MPKMIGDLNGRWAIAFKFLLLTWPVAIAWAGWVSLVVIEHGNRITRIETILATLTP